MKAEIVGKREAIAGRTTVGRGDRLVENDHGFAVVVAMMGLLVMSAVGIAIALSSAVETITARNFRDGAGAAYAAEALALHSIRELSDLTDWTQALDGTRHSAWFDGAGSGIRRLVDGSPIDLEEILNLANCGKPTACSTAELVAADIARPWGASNPQWQLFACGRLDDLLGVPSPFYAMLLVADDPAETDLDPLADGAEAANPGSGVLLIRAEAFGPGGIHSAIELTVARTAPASPGSSEPAGAVRIVSWRAVQ